jgi:1-acyl-sn-glycerol-3-phosphate acyltransferase
LNRRIRRAWLVFVYYLSWLVFGSVGVLLNVVCIVLLPLPGRSALEPTARATIRRLFEAWVSWLHASRVTNVTWRGFDEETLTTGTVYVANHPSLIDATLILARLPDAVCIFKPSLMRNPAVGPAALVAGYVKGDTGLDLIKAAAAKVAAGRSLLVFPEGTRTTPGALPGRMKPGFALIAERAKAPVRLVTIRSSPGLCERGRPWWPAPAILPGWVEITLDGVWPHVPGRSAAELTLSIERRVCEVLSRPSPN